MKLSTKTRYTVRALIDLAVNDRGKPSQIKDIARRQDLSKRYLENLFTSLRANGILISSKGRGGGFSFNRALIKIDLLEVIEAVEGKMSLSGCVESDSFCKRSSDCVARNIWMKANDILKDYFHSITLNDLLKEYKKKAKNKNRDMYYI